MVDGSPAPDVYLDTSAVVAAIFGGIPHSQASAAYFASLEAAGSRLVFSRILRLELSQVIARLPHDALFPEALRRAFRLDRWDTNAQVRAQWMARPTASSGSRR